MDKALPLHKPSPPRRPESTAWLSGLRGMASIIVALNHYLYGEFDTPWSGFGSSQENRRFYQLPFIRVIWGGHAMPTIFFVVSGYCACYSALQLRESLGPPAMITSLSRSAFRRGLRLYLPVIFMAFLAQTLLFCGAYNWRWTEVALKPWTAPMEHLKYLGTYLLDIANPIELTRNPGLNAQFWAIPVEYRGSLIIYTTVLALATCKAHARPVILIGLIAPLVYRGHWTTFTFFGGHLICELSLLRSKSTGGGWRLGRRANAVLFLAAWYLFGLPDNYAETPGYSFLAHIQPANWGHGEDAGQCWRSLAAILLVFSMDCDTLLQSVPSSRIPQYLSTISWEIYLTHVMIYRLWRDSLLNFFMSWFELATDMGLWSSYALSGVVMATLVHWGADLLKTVNRRIVGMAKAIETACIDKDFLSG